MSDLRNNDKIDARVEKLKVYNRAYRAGQPLIDDLAYDRLVEELRSWAPDHPFLHHVEAEDFGERRKVRHPRPMLSTEKAYDRRALGRWVDRVQKAADELGLTDIRYRVTPKLDGLAGRDDGTVLATRGNGRLGYDVSFAFERGVVPIGGVVMVWVKSSLPVLRLKRGFRVISITLATWPWASFQRM